MAEITASIAYAARGGARPYYFANAHHRDHVPIDARAMPLVDGRANPPSLAHEGFVRLDHRSRVGDFTDRDQVAAIHPAEIADLVRDATGATRVIVTAPGIVRFSEASGLAGTRDNSHPARFAHVDTTAETAAAMAARLLGDAPLPARWANYNVWRAFSPAPQDVSLALCAMDSVGADDLIEADAIFDPPGVPEWRFASWVVAANPAHRWYWFPDLTRDEAILFQSSCSQTGRAVPHVAFDNPAAPPGSPPRASIEMRVLAVWE